MELDTRRQQIYELRQQHESFKSIGQRFGITDGRARQLYNQACEYKQGTWSLKPDTRNEMLNLLSNVHDLRHVMNILRDHATTTELQTLAKTYELV